MTPEAAAERHNYIADRHVQNKGNKLPKFEIRKLLAFNTVLLVDEF